MGNILFIDSDDINGLSDALRNALERRGIKFRDYTGEFGYPTDDDEEPDIDPYLGVMPSVGRPIRHNDDDRWLFQESGGSYGYGGCGSGGCGGSGNRGASCGGSSCGQVHYPRC